MIVIYDSDKESARRIKDLLCRDCGLPSQGVDIFRGSSKELIDAVRKDSTHKIRIVFIEISMQTEVNGIDVANKIVSIDKNIHIVFVTSYGKFYIQQAFLDYYDFSPVAYLIKPVNSYFLKRTMEKIGYIEKNRSMIWVKIQQSVVGVKAADVIYIGIDGHCTVLYTEKQEYRTYIPIEKLLKTLPGGFLRCHKSFVINTDHVRSYCENNLIILKNKMEIPVSRSYQRTVRESMKLLIP